MSDETDSYKNADLFDCCDSEELTYDSPGEAIEQLLDGEFEKGEPIVDCIARLSPVTVHAYKRVKVREEWIAKEADSEIECLWEHFLDEFWHPHDPPDVDVSAELRAAAAAMVRLAVEQWDVWKCEPAGKRTYSAAEVEAMMRDQCPTWFEEGSDG